MDIAAAEVQRYINKGYSVEKALTKVAIMYHVSVDVVRPYYECHFGKK